MMNFNFIASDDFDLNVFKDVEKFVDSYPDFQTVVLNDEEELKLLLKHIGIERLDSCEIKSTEFTKYWNLSEYHLPELNEEEFELFYKKWIEISGRENNMDEFGNLIFLQGMSPKWNKMTHRLIVKEQ
tara:strand:+ start:64 stop:447 length:384 start_codon:yes stop_codon:yes gene_type:complete